MPERIINRGLPNYDQTNMVRPIRGSVQDTSYPEMNGFDLREEFTWLMMGNFENPGVGRPGIYRKLTNTRCACFSIATGSADPNCIYCNGEGYLFTEEVKLIYFAKNFGSVLAGSTQISQQSQLSSYGVSDANRALAFMFWYDIPDYERYAIPNRQAPDKLFELKVDSDGQMTEPIIRTEEWRIRSLTAHHGDNGRVEYFELGIEKLSV
jgi:hypothetical protein